MKKTTYDGALSAEQRDAAKKQKIIEIVNGWLPGLTDEAFHLADHGDSRVNWNNMHEIADHICGCLAMHAQHEILEEFEEVLEDMQSGEAQV